MSNDLKPESEQPTPPALASVSGSEDSALTELQQAALHYSHEYFKAPGQSGFQQWSDACERLETAAVQYTKSLSPQNADVSDRRDNAKR